MTKDDFSIYKKQRSEISTSDEYKLNIQIYRMFFLQEKMKRVLVAWPVRLRTLILIRKSSRHHKGSRFSVCIHKNRIGLTCSRIIYILGGDV